MLIENDEILVNNKKIAYALNSYFDSVTLLIDYHSLDDSSWSTLTQWTSGDP